jgi:hypothetical protein
MPTGEFSRPAAGSTLPPIEARGRIIRHTALPWLLFTRPRRRGILRTSPFGDSRKFVFTGFYEVRPQKYPPAIQPSLPLGIEKIAMWPIGWTPQGSTIVTSAGALASRERQTRCEAGAQSLWASLSTLEGGGQVVERRWWRGNKELRHPRTS